MAAVKGRARGDGVVGTGLVENRGGSSRHGAEFSRAMDKIAKARAASDAAGKAGTRASHMAAAKAHDRAVKALGKVSGVVPIPRHQEAAAQHRAQAKAAGASARSTGAKGAGRTGAKGSASAGGGGG